MKKLVAPALLVAALTASALVGASSVSWAQETGPSCAEASSVAADALIARDAAKVPSNLEQQARNTQAALDTALEAQATAEERLRATDAFQNDNVDNDGDQDAEFADATAAKATADTAVANATTARDAAATALSGAQTALATAETNLDSAETAREIACAEPGVEPYANCDEAAAANDVPVLASNPRYNLALDSDADGIGCEVNGNDDQDNGNGNDDQGNDNGSDNGVDNNEDDGLNPGPIVGAVVTPVGGVETGGGPE